MQGGRAVLFLETDRGPTGGRPGTGRGTAGTSSAGPPAQQRGGPRRAVRPAVPRRSPGGPAGTAGSCGFGRSWRWRSYTRSWGGPRRSGPDGPGLDGRARRRPGAGTGGPDGLGSLSGLGRNTPNQGKKER